MNTRLAKEIAAHSEYSRRAAEKLIHEGRVTVNGVKVLEQGTKVESTDIIKIDGVKLKKKGRIYLMFNKPKNVLCTNNDPRGRATVMDYMLKGENVHPVGRLDYDTTGLLLMTNDGAFTKKILAPSNKIYKTYRAKIDGILILEEINMIKKGLKTKHGDYAPAKIKLRSKNLKNNTAIYDISIYEGKYHEVKNIFKHFNKNVLKLDRISIGPLHLGNLPRGSYRKLTDEEIKIFMGD